MIYKKYDVRVEKEASPLFGLKLEQRRDYENKIHEIRNDFRDELLAKHQVTNHPKANQVWEKSWDRGHSSGFSEVEIIFDDLVELIK